MGDRRLEKIRDWAQQNLTGCILPWWCSEYIIDREHNCFYGVVTLDMQRNHNEPNGLTLLGRMLYIFSAAYRKYKGQIYRDRADFTYKVLMEKFYDKVYGGAFSAVNEDGVVVYDVKPNYCEAFFVMGLAEYYHATGCKDALDICMETVHKLERTKIGPGIYHATMNRDWSIRPGFDNGRGGGSMGLPNDAIMFSHHLCQAYYRLWQATHDEIIAQSLRDMIAFLLDKLYDPINMNFMTLVTQDFKRVGSRQSYGHDCELSYLVINIVNDIGEEPLKKKAYEIVKSILGKIVLHAFDENGALYNGVDLLTNEAGNVHVWWTQAEAVSAMLCGYEITGEDKYLTVCEKQIDFIDKYFVNRETGDWYNNILSDKNGGHLSDGQHGFDKLNPGKCPFHNGQMCMESIDRIDRLLGKA